MLGPKTKGASTTQLPSVGRAEGAGRARWWAGKPYTAMPRNPNGPGGSPVVYRCADWYPNPSKEGASGSGTIRPHSGLPLTLGDRCRNLLSETL